MAKQVSFLVLIMLFCAYGTFSQSQNTDAVDADALCKRIAEIKALPHYDEQGVDAVYDSLAAANEAVIPCLIEKITDTAIMPDPRCPRISEETRVGDVAYFVLVRITKMDFAELLPVAVQETYKTEGVYAYHDYIDKKGSRKQLQSRLRELYRQDYKR